MVELKLIEDLIEKILETYTRYSGVDDEEQKKKVLGLFYVFFNLVVGGHTFFFFLTWPFEKKLGNSGLESCNE